MMSPSFSRSSSSTTTTALPAAMSSMARSTESSRTDVAHAGIDSFSSTALVSVTVRASRRHTTKPITTKTA